MARTGFCDSKPSLDLHKKADERRAPSRTWANACGPLDRCQPVEVEESRTAPVKVEPERRWERRASSQTAEDIISGFHEHGRTCKAADGCVEALVLLYPHGSHGRHSLHTSVPSLSRHEVELASEKSDLIWDPAYAWDMFLDMMRTQIRSSLPSADLPRHFTDATRAILVDWLIQVHEISQFQEETSYSAVHLLNRSSRQSKVTTANSQLLGIVCSFLAAKKEESLLPEVSGLCSLMDHTYTKHQLSRMERKVSCALNFDSSYCPPLHFLLSFASVARSSAMVVWMARYSSESSLSEGQCVVFSPVQSAGAALCLARQALQECPTPEGEAAWCSASSIHIGSESTSSRIMHILASAAAKASSQETCATFIKFSSQETLQVSRHPGSKNAPSSSGVYS